MAAPIAFLARDLRIIRFDEWRRPPSPWSVDRGWTGKGGADVVPGHPHILPRAETVGDKRKAIQSRNGLARQVKFIFQK